MPTTDVDSEVQFIRPVGFGTLVGFLLGFRGDFRAVTRRAPSALSVINNHEQGSWRHAAPARCHRRACREDVFMLICFFR